MMKDQTGMNQPIAAVGNRTDLTDSMMFDQR